MRTRFVLPTARLVLPHSLALALGGLGLDWAIALLLAAALVINRRAGEPWPAALPTGYAPSLLGVLVFAAGGVGDLL